MATEEEVKPQLAALCSELNKRATSYRFLTGYEEGVCPLPAAVVEARVTKAYRMLMPMAEAPWGSLVVGSSLDRLEVAGVRDVDDNVAEAVWGSWQDNQMDSESKLAHHSSLLSGRAYALVWPETEPGKPEISLDSSEQMVVQYRPGSRRHRVAALRRFVENGVPMATLYRPDGIYKFQGAKSGDSSPTDMSWPQSAKWERRQVPGEEWPVPNPYGVVPVVELAVNRRLKPGSYGHARGEFEHCTGLIDRINLLTFLGLVVAFWMGFPFRAVIGDRILRTDDGTPFGTPMVAPEGKPVPPIAVNADSIGQFEDPNTKLAEFGAADRKNLSVYSELDQLATITKTPRHYFPLENGMSNLSADPIRASEGGLSAKTTDHKASLGEGWEEVLRIAGLMLDKPVMLSPRAELLWKDHESRSLAERADAASKLKDLLPWQAVAERALNATSDEITRWETLRANDPLSILTAAAKVAASNGNGTAPVAA